jgi:hypothetical protein
VRRIARSLGLVLAAAIAPAAPAADAVDRALVGTWQLEWPRPALYWVVRADGVYRMHGPGAVPRQLGRLETQDGRFSLASAVWVDSGTYRATDDRLVITGKLGPGTWRRIWRPARMAGATVARAAGPGACGLLSADEAAEMLGAPATGGPDPRAGDGGCLFRSGLSNLDSLTIQIRRNEGRFFQNVRKSAAQFAIDVPGVGEQAWAKAGGADDVEELAFLRGNTWVRVQASLQPGITRIDLPALATVASAIDRRLSGFALPEPQLSAEERARLEKLERKTERSSGGTPGGTPWPQRGPQPFEDW